MPTYLDSQSTEEIVVIIENDSGIDLGNVVVDLSDLQKYFDIQDKMEFPGIRKGMTLREDIKFRPKYDEGSFPVVVTIRSGDSKMLLNYTIKVGGTEIY